MSNPLVFNPPLVFNSVLSHLQLNALDAFVSQSINGVTGGAAAPATTITIGGAGLDVTGPSNLSNAETVTVTVVFTLNAGAVANLAGATTISGGGSVTWTGGSFLTTDPASTVTLNGTTNAGGNFTTTNLFNMSGTPRLTGAVELGISPARAYQRARVSLLEIDTTTWARSTPESATYPLTVLQAVFTTGLVTEQIGWDVDVPDGATITDVSVALKGGGAAHTPGVPPVIRLHKINLATGAQTDIATEIDGAAGAAYIATHDVTITGLAELVDRTNFQYVVRVQGEGAAAGVLGLRANAPRVLYTRAKVGED